MSNTENSALPVGSDDLVRLLDAAITLLAGWCDAIKNGDASWDSWDEWYKDACYRPGPLREMIDAKMEMLLPCETCNGTGDIIRADGEWLGPCPHCKPNDPTHPPA